ncbi:SOS response-associated peptidase [soil metagenome]
MCGRYVTTTDADGLVKFFVLDDRDPAARTANVRWQGGANYNVAPTDPVPAVVRHDGQLVITELRWGLVPFWADDRRIGARMINARAETVADKPAFAKSFAERRCLIPADGFYEWEKVAGKRLPWLVRRTDGDPMVFAGIWSSWRPPATDTEADRDTRVLTCSIITTTANGVLQPIHDRMPAVLGRAVWDAWLDPQSDLGDLRQLLGPAPDSDVDRRRVSTRVNSIANNDPSLLEEVSADDPTPQGEVVGPDHPSVQTTTDDGQQALFD